MTHMQTRRIKGAIETIKNKDRETIRDFLFGMIEPEERDLVQGLMEKDR